MSMLWITGKVRKRNKHQLTRDDIMKAIAERLVLERAHAIKIKRRFVVFRNDCCSRLSNTAPLAGIAGGFCFVNLDDRDCHITYRVRIFAFPYVIVLIIFAAGAASLFRSDWPLIPSIIALALVCAMCIVVNVGFAHMGIQSLLKKSIVARPKRQS